MTIKLRSHATPRPEEGAQPEHAGPATGAAEIRAAVALSAAAERQLAASEADMRRLNPGPDWLKDMLARRARRLEAESHIRRRRPKGARAYEEARDRERRAASAAFSPGDPVGHVLDGAGAARRVEEVLGCGLVRLGEKPGSRIVSELAEPEDLWHADQTPGPPAAEPHRGRPAQPPRHRSAGFTRAAAQPSLFGP